MTAHSLHRSRVPRREVALWVVAQLSARRLLAVPISVEGLEALWIVAVVANRIEAAQCCLVELSTICVSELDLLFVDSNVAFRHFRAPAFRLGRLEGVWRRRGEFGYFLAGLLSRPWRHVERAGLGRWKFLPVSLKLSFLKLAANYILGEMHVEHSVTSTATPHRQRAQELLLPLALGCDGGVGLVEVSRQLEMSISVGKRQSSYAKYLIKNFPN
eukprot:2113268-Pleurochrysis_carterae.AAC.3